MYNGIMKLKITIVHDTHKFITIMLGVMQRSAADILSYIKCHKWSTPFSDIALRLPCAQFL